MAKAKIDMKQFLLQRGEHVGLGVAGGVALLLVVLSLFMPGSGFFNESPETKAKEIKVVTEQVSRLLQTNTPKETDLPSAKDADQKLVNLTTTQIDGSPFNHKPWVPTGVGGPLGRRVPKVLPIEEATAKLARMQVHTYALLFRDRDIRVICLKGAEGGTGGTTGTGEPMGKRPPGALGGVGALA